MAIDYRPVRDRLASAILHNQTLKYAVSEELREAGASAPCLALSMLVATLCMRDVSRTSLRTDPSEVDIDNHLVLVNDTLFVVQSNGVDILLICVTRRNPRSTGCRLSLGPCCRFDTASYVGVGVSLRSAGIAANVLEWINSIGEGQICCTRPLRRRCSRQSPRR